MPIRALYDERVDRTYASCGAVLDRERCRILVRLALPYRHLCVKHSS